MWTAEQRQAHDRAGLRYPSDLTDAEWALVDPSGRALSEIQVWIACGAFVQSTPLRPERAIADETVGVSPRTLVRRDQLVFRRWTAAKSMWSEVTRSTSCEARRRRGASRSQSRQPTWTDSLTAATGVRQISVRAGPVRGARAASHPQGLANPAPAAPVGLDGHRQHGF
jgi:hypothetical protein